MSSVGEPSRPSDRWWRRLRAAESILAFGLVLLAIGIAVSPIFADLSKYGGHDWDAESTHRFIVVKSLREFGQFPFWNPYTCGGYSDWANVQGAPNLVSPFFPIYLLADIRLALRLEIVGTSLLAAIGTWLWAGLFTRSPAARAFACLIFVVNGRWALQTTTGHAWHLYYAWMPWVFYFFERAIDSSYPRRLLSSALFGGLAFAMLIYNSAIYPLPHCIALLALYGGLNAIFTRKLAPLFAGGAIGITGIALAAPKLLPTMADFERFPRLVESKEAIELRTFIEMFIARNQSTDSRPAPTPAYGWHEYGIYVGAPACLLLVILIWYAKSSRERALRICGLVALLLGLGAFHDYAPWTLLHEVSIFRSQHVPTRWMYPAVLMFGVLGASVLERVIRRAGRAAPLVEGALLIAVAALAIDLGTQAERPMRHAFWMEAGPFPRESEFHQEQKVPTPLAYRVSDYSPAALPAMKSGVGVLECGLHAQLGLWGPKDARGRPLGQGARGRHEADYRGEAYTASGQGRASIVRFTPNAVVVRVEGANPGDQVVINQNYDPSWSVNGRRAINFADAVGAPIEKANDELTFRYRPRGFWLGIVTSLLTLLVYAALFQRKRIRAFVERRFKRAQTSPPASAPASVSTGT